MSEKETEIIKDAVYDLSQWYDNLLEQNIDMTTIIGILELAKIRLIEETWESIEND
jgi:hypothetical protein|tara:strand:+ start:345 stop:512 length:168 start_codon:yes stop_codon:yes gene_type:complete